MTKALNKAIERELAKFGVSFTPLPLHPSQTSALMMSLLQRNDLTHTEKSAVFIALGSYHTLQQQLQGGTK